MRHVLLTCKGHATKRWQCKSIAFTPGHGYNGSRHIFFLGEKMDGKYQPADECRCPASDLILAPEDPWGGLPLDEQRKVIQAD